jgi:sRNA-binding regulator protein Hfq
VNGIKVKGDFKNWISYFENQDFSISILRNGILLDNSIHEFSKMGFEKYTVSILPNITTDQKNKFFSWSGISL